MKTTVVGSGFVGQTAAMRLLEKGLGDVVLIDIIEGKPQGLALWTSRRPRRSRGTSPRSSARTTTRTRPAATSS